MKIAKSVPDGSGGCENPLLHDKYIFKVVFESDMRAEALPRLNVFDSN